MVLLGSTGSIGRSALDIARRFGVCVEMITAGKNIELLNRQIKEFSPKIVVVQNKEDVPKVDHHSVFFGEEGILRGLEESKSETVVNAIVGFAGLTSTLKAQELGKKIALANKESLVAAGRFIDCSSIIPIDSEHFGLWYLKNDKAIKRLLITASGGAFRDTPLENIKKATKNEALKHPNWEMGQKITIDSATMANKLFELLEARWLFDIEDIDAIIETKSIFHALIDFKDGSTTAHIANADMRLPIAFSILGEVNEEITKSVDFTKIKNIEFREIEQQRYPLWSAKELLLKKPELGVVFNAANEVCVAYFLEDKITFGDISDIVLEIFDSYKNTAITQLEDVFCIDKETRLKTAERILKAV